MNFCCDTCTPLIGFDIFDFFLITGAVPFDDYIIYIEEIGSNRSITQTLTADGSGVISIPKEPLQTFWNNFHGYTMTIDEDCWTITMENGITSEEGPIQALPVVIITEINEGGEPPELDGPAFSNGFSNGFKIT